jgi:hypothetical protein
MPEHKLYIERPDRFGLRMKVFDVRRAESLDLVVEDELTRPPQNEYDNKQL